MTPTVGGVGFVVVNLFALPTRRQKHASGRRTAVADSAITASCVAHQICQLGVPTSRRDCSHLSLIDNLAVTDDIRRSGVKP